MKYLGVVLSPVQQMLNSQAISISQKWKMWKEHKEEKFKNIANDPESMFDYFFENNDIFKFIKPEDQLTYAFTIKSMNRTKTDILLSCIAGVFIVDKLILNRFFPKLRFKQWRLTANLLKFIVWPSLIYQPLSHQLLTQRREKIQQIQNKYHFGFQDYIEGNKIFERALAVNRLEELFEKRDKFDWSSVPELQQE